MKPSLILASASPRRKELLTHAGIDFTVSPADLDESILPNELPQAMVLRLAIAKAKKISETNQDKLVLAADTTVAIDNKILGKPVDENDAKQMLALLQNRWSFVYTAFCLSKIDKNYLRFDITESQVKFAPMSIAEIDNYVATKEPLDKAGAYALQGIGTQYIEEIKGSYSAIIGLDLVKLKKFLREDGHKF